MKLSTVRACASDVQKLIEVQNAGFYDDYTAFGECPSYNEPAEELLDLIRHAIVYKIVADGRIVGDVIVRPIENHAYCLRVISVIPAYQNRGVGSAALKTVEHDLADARKWSLITPEKSLRNHHFYEKFGYRKTGEIIKSEKLTLWSFEKHLSECCALEKAGEHRETN